LKDAALDAESRAPQADNQVLVRGLRDVRRGRGAEAGPASPPHVGEQGELRDDQHAAADVDDRPVHASLVVAEDPQISNLGRRVVDIGRFVAIRHPDEDDEPRADRADDAIVDGHGSAGNALNNAAH
jgi:hypothetical protein